MKKIRIFVSTIITTVVLLISPMSLAETPFPALTITNLTNESPILTQCGTFGSFYIPLADPAKIRWATFFSLFSGPSGTCSIISNNEVIATFTVVVSPSGQQGMVSATNAISTTITFTFTKSALGGMAPNVDLIISSEAKSTPPTP